MMMPRLFFAILLACGLTACEPPRAGVGDSVVVNEANDLEAVRNWVGATSSPSQASNPSGQALPSVDSMLTGLETRLEAAPNDVKGWTLLATSYAYVGRLDDARSAQKTAVALGADRDALEQQILAAHTGTRN